MDPTVRITETSPGSMGARIRGFLAKDVWMTCFVENLPKDLSVRWQRTMQDKDGRETVVGISQDLDIQDNMKWSIEKPTPYSWRLRIKGLELQDEGNYSCFVTLTSNNNRVMDNRTVIVTDKPIILEEFSSSDVTVREGEDLELRCNASGRPHPTIMWKREGNNILPGGGVVIMGSKFDIKDIQWDARGRYFCDALNEVGSDRRAIHLRVTHTPRVVPEASSLGQKVGWPRMLVCNIDANPVPRTDPDMNQLYWTLGPQRIAEGSRHTIRVLEGAYGRLTYELIIRSVTREDYGEYQCAAANSIGVAAGSITLYESAEVEYDKSWLLRSSASLPSAPSSLLLAVCGATLLLSMGAAL
jgi:hypothetical protein